MRKNPTAGEERLWQALRNRKVMRLKFRRQHAIGNYIADFCCPEVGLIVEVDGPIHEAQTEQDAFRDRELESLRYRVVRFKEEDVLRDTAEVLAKLVEFIRNERVSENSPLRRFSKTQMERGRG
jgi:very-short-patch-repair endonuclease